MICTHNINTAIATSTGPRKFYSVGDEVGEYIFVLSPRWDSTWDYVKVVAQVKGSRHRIEFSNGSKSTVDLCSMPYMTCCQAYGPFDPDDGDDDDNDDDDEEDNKTEEEDNAGTTEVSTRYWYSLACTHLICMSLAGNPIGVEADTKRGWHK